VKRIQWRPIARALMGRPAVVLTEDRRVLEQVIFAHYTALAEVRTVLFVGCESYTEHYERSFFAGHNYWTIEVDPGRRRFGGKRHVTGRLEQLGQHFPRGFFDLIVCNGVYGWGLDLAKDCETALSECHACLADNGHLIFGWNDIPRWDPAPLALVRAFSSFAEHVVPTLGSKYLTETTYRHTYRFLQKT
jgi:SAM-dependent methyltransferase